MVTKAALEQQGGATVNDVADELGIDQSGASRFITRPSIAATYARSPDPATPANDSWSSPTRALTTWANAAHKIVVQIIKRNNDTAGFQETQPEVRSCVTGQRRTR